MDTDERACRDLLSRNIKRFRGRIGLSQMDLALALDISITFLSDIETGKKWVSARTLAQIAKALRIEVYELFLPEGRDQGESTAAVAKYLDGVDETVIRSIEEAVRPAVRRALKKIRGYYGEEVTK
jgi:transcriptional regulator with XRE-family HTH domain